jgi:hypothetical protein
VAAETASLNRPCPGQHCDRARQILEAVVAGDEIGLGVDFDHHGGIAFRRDSDQAFGGGAAGLLVGLGNALGAQPVDSGFHVAVGFASAFLQSIMPAPVLSRSSFTIAAVMLITASFILGAPGPAAAAVLEAGFANGTCSTCH